MEAGVEKTPLEKETGPENTFTGETKPEAEYPSAPPVEEESLQADSQGTIPPEDETKRKGYEGIPETTTLRKPNSLAFGLSAASRSPGAWWMCFAVFLVCSFAASFTSEITVSMGATGAVAIAAQIMSLVCLAFMLIVAFFAIDNALRTYRGEKVTANTMFQGLKPQVILGFLISVLFSVIASVAGFFLGYVISPTPWTSLSVMMLVSILTYPIIVMPTMSVFIDLSHDRYHGAWKSFAEGMKKIDVAWYFKVVGFQLLIGLVTFFAALLMFMIALLFPQIVAIILMSVFLSGICVYQIYALTALYYRQLM